MNGFAELFFHQYSVGNGLNAIARPGEWFFFVAAPTAALLVFIGDPGAIAFTDSVNFADEPPGTTAYFIGPQLGRFVVERNSFEVQSTTGVHVGVGDADLFDFFEIE
jgi:hypothetical protein